ncbi:MAG: hypothetical protein NTV72_03195 [Candidatus Taylorbacteria bacterium]|nr:hypothetical protein [Candidatus Taylorbacteria bacterium]
MSNNEQLIEVLSNRLTTAVLTKISFSEREPIENQARSMWQGDKRRLTEEVVCLAEALSQVTFNALNAGELILERAQPACRSLQRASKFLHWNGQTKRTIEVARRIREISKWQWSKTPNRSTVLFSNNPDIFGPTVGHFTSGFSNAIKGRERWHKQHLVGSAVPRSTTSATMNA